MALTWATKYAETEPEPSSRTGRRCGKQRRTWKQEQNWIYFRRKSLSTGRTVTPRSLSPSVTNSVSSHCITLILLGQTINLLDESQTQENWGLFAHQPPIGLQYSTICSTNNTLPRTRLACTRLHRDRLRLTRLACARLHLDGLRLHTPCLHASSP